MDNDSNISSNVFIRVDHLVFECNVSDADSEILGCIILIHNHTNHSIIHMDMINRENPKPVEQKIELERTTVYSFAVLTWRSMSGLIGSNTLLKGTLCAVDAMPPYDPTEGIHTNY